MHLTVDLHSHSGHAGGVGNVSLDSVAETMARKGIDVFGTGDCLHPAWMEQLASLLAEREPGLFALDQASATEAHARARFLLQSEIIVTCAVPSGGRKGTHTVLLFPNFGAAAEASKLLQRLEVKIGIGRPFLKCEDAGHVADCLDELLQIDERILVIPAHVLTPQGIYGSDHPVDSMRDVYGAFAERIVAVETGLSADPEILALIPELDSRALLSNSDCHSAALNRVGREFTRLDVQSASYDEILTAIRNRAVTETIEFTPAEGRYFLTGHRAGKRGHDDGAYCYFSPDRVPEGNECPICGKSLTVGVLQRALELGTAQGDPRTLESTAPRQPFRRLVPLTEVLAAGLGVKNVSARKVLSAFDAILRKTGTEVGVWDAPCEELDALLDQTVPESVLQAIKQTHAGEFTFEPLGYDGEYGNLVLGRHGDWFGHARVHTGSVGSEPL